MSAFYECELGNVKFNVQTDLGSIRDIIEDKRGDWGESEFYELWTDTKVSKEEYMRSIDEVLELLDGMEEDPSLLVDSIEVVTKKKNGEFRKGGVAVISYLENTSEYYTDFTNAWSVGCIELKALDGKTCELRYNNRQCTN